MDRTVGNNVSVGGAAGAAGAAAVLPAGGVQCPVRHPFSRLGENGAVDACCKCGDQSKCTPVGDIGITGINHYNIGGVNAMQADDDVVDKSKSNSLKCTHLILF